MLGKKQSISNSEWVQAMANIENTVSKKEIDSLIDRTVEEIRRTCRGKGAAFGWSGGKDSIALEFVCRQAGIDQSLIGISNLEYPAFRSWIDENKPDGLEIINTGQDMNWLVKNLHMLFPDGKRAARWFAIVQHTAQKRYFKRYKPDLLILGRRRADGNYIGRGSNIYENREGITRYSPIAYWRHEDVLALIHYYQLKMPPIYDWPNGYKCGTHPWPARPHVGTVKDGWREIYHIDPSIVEMAAERIESAKNFLEEM